MRSVLAGAAPQQPEAAEILCAMLDMHRRYNVSTSISFHRLNRFAEAACAEWTSAAARLASSSSSGSTTRVSISRVSGNRSEMNSAEREAALSQLRKPSSGDELRVTWLDWT